MDSLKRTGGTLTLGNVSLQAIAEKFGTPCYVYDFGALGDRLSDLSAGFGAHPHRICYAVKASSNISILKHLASLGAGFDIVSGGELYRLKKIGANLSSVVFSGVGKTRAEMAEALKAKISCFNVESAHELYELNEVAREIHAIAPIALRINPDINIDSHPYICTGGDGHKFGIPYKEAVALYQKARSLEHVTIKGIACHIGSQMLTLEPLLQAAEQMKALIGQLKALGVHLDHIDMGGGLGIAYEPNDTPIGLGTYTAALVESFKETKLPIWIEPGRCLIGPVGCLLTKVLGIKSSTTKQFMIVDAAMTDFARPSLYQAWHAISPVLPPVATPSVYDVVGGVCETSDFIALDRELSCPIGGVLCIHDAGAYGMSMSSQYNSRPIGAEVAIIDGKSILIRNRQSYQDVMKDELLVELTNCSLG